MSEIKHFKGTLEKVNEIDIQEFAKKFIEDNNVEITQYQYDYHNNDYSLILVDEFPEEFMFIDDILFKINSESIDPDDDILNFNYNEENDKYYFECKFYNGGTNLSEMLESGYKKYNKKW